MASILPVFIPGQHVSLNPSNREYILASYAYCIRVLTTWWGVCTNIGGVGAWVGMHRFGTVPDRPDILAYDPKELGLYCLEILKTVDAKLITNYPCPPPLYL